MAQLQKPSIVLGALALTLAGGWGANQLSNEGSNNPPHPNGSNSSVGLVSNIPPKHDKTLAVTSTPELSLEQIKDGFPSRYLKPLSKLDNSLAEALQQGFFDEFAKSGVTSANDFVRMVSEGLLRAGLSKSEVARVWSVYISSGALSYQSRKDALSSLIALMPEQASSLEHGVSLSQLPLPSGRVSICILDSEIDSDRSGELPSPTVVLENEFDKVAVDERQGLNGQSKPFRRLVDAKFSVVGGSASGSSVKSFSWKHEFLVDSGDKPRALEAKLAEILQACGADTSAPLKFSIDLAVADYSAEGIRQGSDSSRLFFELFPIQGSKIGANVVQVPGDLDPLRHPALPNAIEIIRYQLGMKDQTKAAIRERIISKASQSKLVGQTLNSIKLENGSELTIPSAGQHLLEFGATWCMPCKPVGATLERRRSSWEIRKDDVRNRIFRLSVDRDNSKGQFASALKDYRDGIVSVADQDKLSISAVPYFILVRDGKIVETGALTPGKLDQLIPQ